MIDWVEGWLTIKAKTGRLHDALLAKDTDTAIQLCAEIAAEARLVGHHLQLEKQKDALPTV